MTTHPPRPADEGKKCETCGGEMYQSPVPGTQPVCLNLVTGNHCSPRPEAEGTVLYGGTALEDINAGNAVIFDPISGGVRQMRREDVDKVK